MSALMVARRRPLAELILGAQARGHSYRDMARRAREHGHMISYAQINNYALGHTNAIPGPRVIEALAAALGVPVPVVRDAVLEEFMEYDASTARTAEGGRRVVMLPPDATEDDVAAAQAMIEAYLARRRHDSD